MNKDYIKTVAWYCVNQETMRCVKNDKESSVRNI